MAEITHCGRTVSGDFVGVDIRWEGDLGGRDSVQWSVFVTSDDEADQIRLGHLRPAGSGDTAEQFVDDLSSGRRQPVEPDADVGDDEIVIRFPTSVVGVAVDWPVWKAVIAVDGEDVATRLIALG